MICVAADKIEKGEYIESIIKWKNEINQVHEDRPIFLVLTKQDLLKEKEAEKQIMM